MKRLLQKLLHIVRRVLVFFLNPRLLLCFGLAWMITNGWAYLFLTLGAILGIPWMAAVGGAYAALLWLPFTPEKIITIPLAILLLRLLFPNDKATLAVLEAEFHALKAALVHLLHRLRAKRTVKRMRRAIIIGCPGSGKSTFARALQKKTGLPLVHLDCLYWREDRTTVSREEFDRLLEEAMQGECWLIDGNYPRTMEKRLAAADTVFFLDYPTEVCIEGIRERAGQPRSDMPWVEHAPDEELLSLVQAFPEEGRPAILALLKKYPQKRRITFHTRAGADEFLAVLREREA
jgi:adenylate kinase family enzyme